MKYRESMLEESTECPGKRQILPLGKRSLSTLFLAVGRREKEEMQSTFVGGKRVDPIQIRPVGRVHLRPTRADCPPGRTDCLPFILSSFHLLSRYLQKVYA
jgi:hypothetical protein